jgi:hypothetical protein
MAYTAVWLDAVWGNATKIIILVIARVLVMLIFMVISANPDTLVARIANVIRP